MGENDETGHTRVLGRLQLSVVGLSSRDIARSVRLAPTEVNRILLELQRKDLVSYSGGRWRASTGKIAGGPAIPATRPPLPRPSQLPPWNGPAFPSKPEYPPIKGGSKNSHKREEVRPTCINRILSRWATFRNLCEYYAECVRLDQGSSIYATADGELDSFVCLDGSLPDSIEFSIRTRPGWNTWMRNVSTTEYLYLGYPLQRYAWRDTKEKRHVAFINPVAIVPCSFEVQGTTLVLHRIGTLRVNEAWLQRRLPNIDQRRSFLQLVGENYGDEENDAGTSRYWRDFADLLNHYYHDWCAEPLNSARLVSSPELSQLRNDGIYNRAGVFVAKKWRYTIKLHKELLALANEIPDDQLDASALRCLFPHVEPKKPAADDTQEATDNAEALYGATVLTLNHEQRQAVKASATEPLSIVVGPPGTGKSRVVAASLGHQMLLGKNALFASRNHQALEAVVPQVNAFTEPWPSILRLSRPFGAEADESMIAALGVLVSSNRTSDPEQIEQFKEALCRRIGKYDSIEESLAQIISLRQEISRTRFLLNERLLDVPEEYRESLEPSAALPSVETLNDVVNQLQIPSKREWSFKYFLRWLYFQVTWKTTLRRANEAESLFRRHCDKLQRLPQLPHNDDRRMVSYLGQCLEFWRPFALANESSLKLSATHRELARHQDVDTVCSALWEVAREIERISRQCFEELAIQAGAGITNEERRLLAEILSTIKNQSGLDDSGDRGRYERAMKKAFPIFLKHYPLVATTNLSVHRDIALQPAVFDLLIVDEASQCDIASVVPLLYRAKRAMFVGDPMQLSHVTSLASATDRHLRRQFHVESTELERFSYRSTSMFDLANAAERVGSRVPLRQHHRCHPSIADYCNNSFYRGSWIILTERNDKQGLSWTHVDDDSEPVPGGGAISRSQIDAILRELERLEQAGFSGSVGVVTPFRRQADRLRDTVFERLPKSAIDRWRLLVDTADGFQGDERDLVMLSLVAGPGLTEGSLRFLANGPNRFNVAVSRARQVLHVFGDAVWARSCRVPHIRQLYEACENERQTSEIWRAETFRHDLVGPVWEPAFAEALRKASLPFYQQYPANGRFLDFALFREGLKLDVEVDGETYHRSAGGGHVEEDIRRDQSLIAAGWTIKRFWVYQLREDMDRCVKQVCDIFEGGEVPSR